VKKIFAVLLRFFWLKNSLWFFCKEFIVSSEENQVKRERALQKAAACMAEDRVRI